ncbi:hypothetical protein Ancab_017146, partial [Ancistrocladus abbreviatus]
EVLPDYSHGAQTYQHGAETFSSGVQPRSGQMPIFLPRPVTDCTIPKATPLTNYMTPHPTSAVDYYENKRREAIYQHMQRQAELSKRMRLDAEHSACKKLEAELSESMKLGTELYERMRLHAEATRMAHEAMLSEHVQLDAEFS